MSKGFACSDLSPTIFSCPTGEGLSESSYVFLNTSSSWKSTDSKSITIGQLQADALLNLWETYNECSKPDWDGYGAEAIIYGTFKVAEALLRSLPTSIPMPDITPEPGGEIGFEWRKNKGNLIVVTVNSKSRLNFASKYGRNTMHGSTDFYGTLPFRVIELIAKIIL